MVKTKAVRVMVWESLDEIEAEWTTNGGILRGRGSLGFKLYRGGSVREGEGFEGFEGGYDEDKEGWVGGRFEIWAMLLFSLDVS